MKRRTFLKTAIAASAYAVTPFNILKAGPSPNSKLNIAVIGVGGQGASNARALAARDNVIALCDVHESWFRRSIKPYEELHDIKLWKDYRVMFDKIGKEIDAVCIATPEHNHYTISMYAMRRGKHVYCQKPLCHTVKEVRNLTEEARKFDVITQMGHQGHSSLSSANIRDWVQDGAIGDVREVIAYSRKNYWTNKPVVTGSTVPDDFDWDLFLNRAEAIPFSDSYMNRNWIDFNHFSGAVGDMAAHIFDAAYYSLDLRFPLSVRADVETPAVPWSLPSGGIITWKFPARGKMPPVTLKYYLGTDVDKGPRPAHLEEGRQASFMESGSVLIGENASIIAGSHSQAGRIIPEATMQEVGRPSGNAFRCKGSSHFENFTLACKGEDKITSPFEYAGPLSEIIVLGDVALMHPNKTLEWDAETMTITNDEAANNSLFMERLNPRDDMDWV